LSTIRAFRLSLCLSANANKTTEQKKDHIAATKTVEEVPTEDEESLTFLHSMPGMGGDKSRL